MKRKNLLGLTLIPLLLSSCGQNVSYEVNDYRLTMNFHDNFKIMQLTDLHLGIESNLDEQLNFMVNMINEADPDLIMLSGDNFMYGSKSIVVRLIDTLNTTCRELTKSHPDRISKFAITYGNHDNQGDYDKYYINSIANLYSTDEDEVESNKYGSFIDYDNDDIFGNANYFIDLVDDKEKSAEEVDVKYRLHVIDSNSYVFNGATYSYDVIHEDQLEHINEIYNSSTNDKDYIGLAFFHIPLTNFKDAIEQYNSSNNKEQIGQGIYVDKNHLPYEDNGSYQIMKESNISAYIVGHDHRHAGDLIYTDENGDKAIFSHGVKSSNQLYHNDDMVGYKLITLKDGISKDEFVSVDYINENFINYMDKGSEYGN